MRIKVVITEEQENASTFRRKKEMSKYEVKQELYRQDYKTEALRLLARLYVSFPNKGWVKAMHAWASNPQDAWRIGRRQARIIHGAAKAWGIN